MEVLYRRSAKGYEHGWRMDDEQIAYPMLEKARELGVRRVCVHKGLPFIEDYNHPRDLIKATKDFPDIDFVVYHAGFRGMTGVKEVFARTGAVPWTLKADICSSVSAPAADTSGLTSPTVRM
jgi:predicted TIM-barrel fold metal-dependent hydrolase